MKWGRKPARSSESDLLGEIAEGVHGIEAVFDAALRLLGVQLRVSTLLLFRGLIRGFPDEFFDADPQSKIGNIRPHVSQEIT